MNKDNSLRFACVERVSTSKQEKKGLSLEEQETLNISCVEELGGIVVKHYKFTESATSGKPHQLIDQLINDANNGIFNAVIVQYMDRLSRDIKEFMKICECFEENNVSLFEGKYLQDLNVFSNVLSNHIRTLCAGDEAKKIVERCYRGRLNKTKMGYPSLGRMPFGFTCENNSEGKPEFKIIPECRELLVKAYHMHVEDLMSFRKIAERLRNTELFYDVVKKNKSGLRTLDPETLRHLLTDKGCRKEWVVKPKRMDLPEIKIPLKETLITPEMCEHVKQRAKLNKICNRKKKYFYALAGYIFCDNCGKALTGVTVGKYSYYRHVREDGCCVNLGKEITESFVFYEIYNFLKDAKYFNKAIYNAASKNMDNVCKLEEQKRDLEYTNSSLASEHKSLINSVGKVKQQKSQKLMLEKIDTISEDILTVEKELIEINYELSVYKNEFDEGLNNVINDHLKLFANRTEVIALNYEKKKDLLNFLLTGKNIYERKKNKHGIFVRSEKINNGEIYTILKIQGVIGVINTPLGVITKEPNSSKKTISHYEYYDDKLATTEYNDLDIEGLSDLMVKWHIGKAYSRNLVDQYQYS